MPVKIETPGSLIRRHRVQVQLVEDHHPTLVIAPTQENGKAQEIPMLPGLRNLLDSVPDEDRHSWVVNPQPIDYQVRSREEWFRPTPDDLSQLANQYGNSAIARACGVTETGVRKWLAQSGSDVSPTTSHPLRDIPKRAVRKLRSRAQQHLAKLQIASTRRLTKEHVGRVTSRIGKEAGIVVQQEDSETGRRLKYASAHDLRRGCAKRLINAGISAETLKIIMRHEDFATTEKFYGATREAQSAAAEVYERLNAKFERTESANGDDSPPRIERDGASEATRTSQEHLKSTLLTPIKPHV